MAGSTERALSAGTNALVLAPAVSDGKRSACGSLLGAADPADLEVLRVSYTRSPEALVDEWRSERGGLPRRMHVVRVRERMGSPEASLGADADAVTVAAANPNDLTGIAMRLRDAVSTVDPSEGTFVVCFDSVTSLLQYGDVESTYKFLHMLTGQLKDVGARAHFHLDPAAVDDRTVARVRSVFDEVVDAG